MSGSEKETLRMVGFKADAETCAALDRLIAALPPGSKRGKSTAIRRALLEAAARLAPIEALPSAAKVPSKVRSKKASKKG